MREDGADAGALDEGVAGFREAVGGGVGAVEGAAEGPAAAGADGRGGGEGVEDEVGAVLEGRGLVGGWCKRWR